MNTRQGLAPAFGVATRGEREYSEPGRVCQVLSKVVVGAIARTVGFQVLRTVFLAQADSPPSPFPVAVPTPAFFILWYQVDNQMFCWEASHAKVWWSVALGPQPNVQPGNWLSRVSH